jgi:hypothetical protein
MESLYVYDFKLKFILKARMDRFTVACRMRKHTDFFNSDVGLFIISIYNDDSGIKRKQSVCDFSESKCLVDK